MLGCRTASAGFVEATTIQQRHNRQHLGAGAQLQNREEVGEIVTQYVAGYRNRIQTANQALHCPANGPHRRLEANVQAFGVVIFQVRVYLLDQLGIMRAFVVKPEHGWHAGGAGTANGQLDPVADWQVFGLASAPDITFFYIVLSQHGAVFSDNTHNAVFLDFKGLVVGAVFFCLLRHQAYVRHGSHGGGIKSTVGFAEVDHFLINRGVGGLRHHRLGVLELAIAGPHLAGVTNHRGHGGINNHVARYVQVGHAFYGIHHGDFRAVLVGLVQGFLDLFLLRLGQLLDFLKYRGKAVVRIYTNFVKQLAILIEKLLVVNLHRVTKHDRVGDLHHGSFYVQGEHYPGFFAVFDGFFKKFAERILAHKHAIKHFAFLQWQVGLEDSLLTFFVLENDAGVGSLVESDGLLVGVKVAAAHVRHVST